MGWVSLGKTIATDRAVCRMVILRMAAVSLLLWGSALRVRWWQGLLPKRDYQECIHGWNQSPSIPTKRVSHQPNHNSPRFHQLIDLASLTYTASQAGLHENTGTFM